jgi:small conductance mechanosensitive channel
VRSFIGEQKVAYSCLPLIIKLNKSRITINQMVTGAAFIDLVQEQSEYFFLVIVILIITLIFQRVINRVLTKAFKKSSTFLKVEETRYRFFRHFISTFIILVGLGLAVYTIPSLRTLSVSLFAGAGILAIVVGFACQQAFANIVSGIFIVIFKPFGVGDRISIGTDLMGIVEDINLRHTVIRDFENKRIIVPNSVISNEKIENSSIFDEKICKCIEFSISYESNIDKAMNIIKKEALAHPLHIDNRTEEQIENKDPVVRVMVVGLGDSGVNLRAWVWTTNPKNSFSLACDLRKSVKEKFDKNKIEIPYPHRVIVKKR